MYKTPHVIRIGFVIQLRIPVNNNFTVYGTMPTLECFIYRFNFGISLAASSKIPRLISNPSFPEYGNVPDLFAA